MSREANSSISWVNSMVSAHVVGDVLVGVDFHNVHKLPVNDQGENCGGGSGEEAFKRDLPPVFGMQVIGRPACNVCLSFGALDNYASLVLKALLRSRHLEEKNCRQSR